MKIIQKHFKDIFQIFSTNDTLITYGYDKIAAFDHKGKYLFDYGNLGDSPSDYSSISNTFIKDHLLHIFDIKQSKVNIYSLSGDFIKYIRIPNKENKISLSKIYPIPSSDQYICLPTYNGTPNTFSPILCKTNNSFVINKESDVANTSSWLNPYNPIVFSESGTLYTRAIYLSNIFHRQKPETKRGILC